VEPLAQTAAQLPTSSGVYLFKDADGGVLYVGKAINIRARVRQYLAGADERTMVPFLVHAAGRVDCVVTETEKEALLLENALIKKHRPRYNVKLRDDSNFLHLRIDLRKTWARYTLVRQIRNDGARYFGPYASASRARSTLAFLQRAFPLRTCTDQVLKSRSRPCLLHQMGRCVAPCVDLVTTETYAGLAEDSMLLLSGRKRAAIGTLRERMRKASDGLAFEEAARLRDLIFGIEATIERQDVVDTKLGDRDVWGLFRDGVRGVVAVTPVREGVMGEPRSLVFPAAVESDAELLSSLLNSSYPEGSLIPSEVVVPVLPEGVAALAELLTERRGRKVVVHAPSRGPKVRMVAMATHNARILYERDTEAEERQDAALASVATLLDLPEPPHRMECFDNSTFQGAQPVAAMAVFLEGRPDRRSYRRYRIKTAKGGDDYGSMREILTRRLKRGLNDGVLPDLLVVDGGRGQLKVATDVREDLGLHDLPMIGIAKPRTERRRGDRTASDKLVLPGRAEPIRLGAGHAGLRLLQHLRDEAHRTAVRYHRKVRSKETLASALEGIPGVGPARRRALLRTLGSLDKIAAASLQELASVPTVGPQLAGTIHQVFHGQGPAS
jgi:excinuclease ABC subunit C